MRKGKAKQTTLQASFQNMYMTTSRDVHSPGALPSSSVEALSNSVSTGFAPSHAGSHFASTSHSEELQVISCSIDQEITNTVDNVIVNCVDLTLLQESKEEEQRRRLKGKGIATSANVILHSTNATVVTLSDSEITGAGSTTKTSSHLKGRLWQDSWATDFPWAEKLIGSDGECTTVRCLVCTRIEGRPCLVALKKDNLRKHAGWRRALRKMPSVGAVAGEWYRLKDNKRVRNERLFASHSRESVHQLLQNEPLDLHIKK